ncbi:MAG TPA: T9SS type A sorting domain-containing protein, partial [Chitinophagales bacterium]|nr:T9SS type A sorting domain-containing protein [Chitinophagales bacterium]
NPAKDKLFIEGVNDNTLLEIFDIKGSLVMQTTLQQSGYVDIHELPSSVYVIKITNTHTNQIGTSKFIKNE